MTRTRAVLLLALMIGAVLIRVLLFRALPVFVTADSWDYVFAAQEIAQRFDFASKALDVRMPGYSLLLAWFLPFTTMQSDRIVVLQIGLGLVAVVLGWFVGYSAKSWLTGLGLALFLAFNPVYLLFEHMVMTETLSILALMGFMSAVLWSCTRRANAAVAGCVVATLFALCVLTRVNLLVFCAVCVVAPLLCWYVPPASPYRVSRRALWTYLGTGIATLLVLVGPWLYRNYLLYGDVSLSKFVNRNLFIYKAMYEPPDTTLPKISAINGVLEFADVNYDWLNRLTGTYPANVAEAIARDLWWEQIGAHPERFAVDLVQSTFGFVGLYYNGAGDLASVHRWFHDYVSDRAGLDAVNRRLDGSHGFRYVPAQEDGGALLVTWRRLGLLYLDVIRPVLYVGLLAVFLRYLWRWSRRRPRIFETRDLVLMAFMAAQSLSAGVHIFTLGVNDRVASSFDLVTVFLLLLTVDTLRTESQNHVVKPH